MGSAATDVFTDIDSGVSDSTNGADEWGTWKLLLEKPANLRGLGQIHLQSFHGRNGMQSFKMMTTTQKGESGAVLGAKDVAEIDADAVAKQLYNLALDYARREACDTFRVQLFKWSGTGQKAELKKGAYAGLRINPVSGAVVWNASAELTPEAKWREICEFLTTEMKDTMGKQGELLVTSTATLITTLQVNDELAQRRREHLDEVAASALPASPEIVTERMKIGIDTFTGTVREAMRWYIWNKTGQVPPSMDATASEKPEAGPDDNAKLQAELLAFFDALDGAVHDKMKGVMGRGNWDGMMAVLRGPLDQFVSNYMLMGPLLAKQLGDGLLDTILPADKLAELKKILMS